MATQAEKAHRRRERNRAVEWTGDEHWHGTSNGYTNYCCRCERCSAAEKAYRDEWRKRPAVAERIRARARILSKRPEHKLREKSRQYGIDRELLGSYLADGICFACDRKVETLFVDHDHRCCPSFRKVCGACVRGLLCRECNNALGQVGDDRTRLLNLIAYLDRWEAKIAPE